jgi:predicted CoA-binding protein
VDVIERIFREFSTIAVVGLSQDPAKAAHTVPAALQAAGYRIVPVNPRGGVLLGEPVYADLRAIPVPVEVVEVFRPAAEAEAIARDAVAIGAKALWLQLGISSEGARKVATEAGLLYVENRCMAVDRARLGVRARSS